MGTQAIYSEVPKLVTSFDWIDFGKLKGIEQDIRDILDQAGVQHGDARQGGVYLLRPGGGGNVPVAGDAPQQAVPDAAPHRKGGGKEYFYSKPPPLLWAFALPLSDSGFDF